MKTIKNIKTICGVVLLLTLSACDFLNVAPARKASLVDAMKDKTAVENWIYGCYHSVGGLFSTQDIPLDMRSYEGSTDEFVTPDLWNEHKRRSIAYGTINSSNVSDHRWRTYYGSIGNVHLFLRELENQNPSFLTEEDKELYRGHAHFLKGYYYFRLLEAFGPVPIIDEYISTSTSKSEFPGRSHFDYCVDYICNELDEAAKRLPGSPSVDQEYGAGNKAICAALKSRLLLYAASPLWNGDFPSRNWKNTTFETPGYGKELVSYQFDVEKWKHAKTAAEEAIAIAKDNGFKLMELEDAALIAQRQDVPVTGCWLPGVDISTPEGEEFAKRVLLMRYVSASDPLDGNREIIMTMRNPDNDRNTLETYRAGMPRRIIKNNSNTWVGGYSGLSPTLQAVEAFYTKSGKLPARDDNFTSSDNWLKSAGISDRPEIINLNVDREPRFYAWITYDGADIGPKLNAGKSFRVDLRDSEKSGYNPTDAVRDQCQTGYLVNKWFSPRTNWTASSQELKGNLWPYIRMAELYLNLAECSAELYMANGDNAELQNALANLNIVRTRAGIAPLSTADCTDIMTIRDWVRAERRNELFMEGHRYYDLRRWVVADQYLSKGVREGLNSFVGRVKNPSIETFNQRVKVEGDYKWDNKLYLLPISQDELYSNPQMMQAPWY